jgi:diguanylate cyclase (GGDEF)-like protein
LENTRRRAEVLREGMKGLKLDPSGPVLPSVTMSIGVACSPEHGETREQLIHAADVALYRAKAQGRDQVVVASDGDVREVEVFAKPEDATRPI